MTTSNTRYLAALLADQPQALFAMDEGAGGVLHDASSHGRQGALVGGVQLGAEGPFEGSQSLEFDGSTGTVALEGSWGGGAELTIEVWIQVTRGGPAGQAVLSAVGPEFVHLQISDDPGYRTALYTDAGDRMVPVLAPAPQGVWRHVALIARPGAVTIVEDGVVLSETACDFTGLIPTSALHIGSGYGGGRFFAGRIGPLAIFDRALTVDRVQAHFRAAQEALTAALYQTALLADRPLALFTMGEAVGTVIHDVSPNGRQGALVGGVRLGAEGPLAGGQSLEFDGSTGTIALAGAWGGGAEITVEVWIQVARGGPAGQAVLSAVGPEFVHLQISDDPGYRTALYTDAGDRMVPVLAPAPQGVWRHVALIARPGAVTIVEDGVVLSETACDFTGLVPTSALHIGSGYGGGRFFAGRIGPLAIFDRALSVDQIRGHLGGAPPPTQNPVDVAVLADGPVAYFNWAETDGDVVRDVAGQGRSGTVHGGVEIVDDSELPGIRCLVLDGTSGEVRLDGDLWGGGTEVSVEAWIRSGRSSTDTQSIVSAADEAFIHLQSNNDSAKRSRLYTESADDKNVELEVLPTLPTDQWRHVVVTARSGSQRLYVDSVLLDEKEVSYGLLSTTRDLRIGCGFAGTRFFQGRIGPVAIYDRALAVENVMAHYRAATGGRGPAFSLGGISITLVADEATSTFKATIDRLPLTTIAAALLGGEPLPPELPEVDVTGVSLQLTPSTGALNLRGSVVTQWVLGGQAVSTTLTVKYSRGAASDKDAKFEVTLAAIGPVEVAPGLVVGNLECAFSYDQKAKKWVVGGGLGVSIFGVSLALGAAYKEEAGKSTVSFFGQLGDSGRTLVDLGGVASIKASQVVLSLTEPTKEAGEEKSDTGLEWSLCVSSGLKILDLADLNGTLEIAVEEGKRNLAFWMDKSSTITIPLVESPPLSFRLSAPRIAFTETTKDGKKSWSLTSQSSAELLGLPEWVHRELLFPRKITGEFKAEAAGVTFRVINLLEPLDLTLPDVDLGGGAILPLSALGVARIHLRELTAKISKKPEVTVTCAFGIPEALNKVFGVDDEGAATANVFRTFNPRQPLTTTVGVTVGIGVGADDKPGVVLRLKDSPLAGLVIQDGVWIVDLGEFGAFEVDLPTFKLKDGGFSGGAGLRVRRDLGIPLGWVKGLLTQVGAGPVASTLPPRIPLMGVQLYDDQGKLSARAVVDYLVTLGEAVGVSLPQEVTEAFRGPLEAIAEFTERIPDTLKPFLSFEIPRNFSFDVMVRQDGSFSVNIWGDEDRPVRMLMPAYLGATPLVVPLLVGVSITRLSLGTLFSNNLLAVQATSTIDVFDIATLAGGMVIPPNKWLPQGNQMTRRIIVDNLMMFVITATKIPIPIPVFYDRLAFQSQGPEGVYVSGGIRFPMPKLDIAEAVRMFGALRHFFSEPAAKLPMIEASELNLEIAEIAVGSAQSVWALNSAGELLHRADDGSGTWSRVEAPARPTHVTVGVDGTPWILAGDGIPHRREADGTWTAWSESRFTRLDAGARDQAVGVNVHGWLYRYRAADNAWEALPSAPPDHRATAVLTDATGVSWMLADYHPVGGTVERGRIFIFSAGTWSWDPNRRFRQLSIASTSMHAAIGLDARIHLYAPGPGWHTLDDPLPQAVPAIQASISPAGDLWVVGQDNALFQRVGGRWEARGKAQGALPRGADLRFAIEDALVRLPPYLGGSTLGKAGDLIELSAVRSVSGLLNAIKFGTLGDLIQILDLGQRKGNQQLSFFFIDFVAQWLLSTPREFREGAAASIGVADLEVTRYLGLLPDARDDDGAVIFLRGAWALADGLGSMETAFGLMMSQGGFVTGLRHVGRIAGIFDLEISGRLQIDARAPSFLIDGSAHLDLAGARIFSSIGALTIMDERFEVAGQLRLFPDGAPLQLRADLRGRIDAHGVDFHGLATINALAVGPIAASEVALTNQGLFLRVAVLGQALGLVRIGDLGSAHGFEFAAKLGPMTAQNRLAIAKDGRSGSYKLTATDGAMQVYGDLAIEAAQARGSLALDLFGRRVLDGSISAGADHFAVSGEFCLFPGNSPIQLRAALSGRLDSGGLTLSGQTTSNSLAGTVLGSSQVELSPTGLRMGASVFGQQVGTVVVGDFGPEIGLDFSADLGLVKSSHSVRFDKAGFRGSYALSGGVGPFSYATKLEIGGHEMRGGLWLDGFGQRLLTGSMRVDGQTFRIEGTGGLHLPLMQLVATFSGELSRGGLRLRATGGASFGIHGLPFAGAEVSLSIADAALTVGLKMWIGPVQVDGIASMRTWEGQTCFMAAWLEGPNPPFLGTGHCNRLIVYPDGRSRLDWHWMTWGDDGWPMDLRPDGGPISFADGDDEAVDPTAEISALAPYEAVRALLAPRGAAEDDQARADRSLRALKGLERHSLTMCTRAQEGGEEVTLSLTANPESEGIFADLAEVPSDEVVAFSADQDGELSAPRPRALILRSGGADGPVAELELEGDAPAIRARFDVTRPESLKEALGSARAGEAKDAR